MTRHTYPTHQELTPITLQLDSVTKRFGTLTAADAISLTLPAGRVLGLLGSNGAGKTTTIRMILSILLPDTGHISWHGHPLTYTVSRQFGYLPEERGLYPKMKVGEQLTYLASLHGMAPGDAAAAVAHRPPLLILDEPFSGLDPVNVQILQESLRHLIAEGTTLLFSSHRLDQVALIHRARLVLSGDLREVKRQAGRQMVRLLVDGPLTFLERFPGVTITKTTPDYCELKVPAATDPQALLHAALAAGPVRRFEQEAPSLEEIYLERVGGVPA